MDYKACVPEVSAGEKVEFAVSGIEFEAKYYVKMLAYSYGRNYSASTDVLSAETTVNHAPVIELQYEEELELMSAQTLNIPVRIYDPDSHKIEVKHEKASDAESLMQNPDGGWRLTIKGADAEVGTYVLKLIAADEYGMTTTLPVTYVIKENSAPEKIKDIENVLLTAKGREFIIDMTEYATDPDEEQLKYDITMTSSKVVHITAKGDELIGTSLGYGSVDVTVVAKDARGEKVTFEFKVTVKDPSDPLSLYPTPATDYLNVSTLDLADTEIIISSSTGKVMFRDVMK